MLDIKYVREHLDEVAETMKNRHASFSPEQFTALDVQRREPRLRRRCHVCRYDGMALEAGRFGPCYSKLYR